MGNTLSNPKGSCRNREVLKQDGMLDLHLKTMNKMISHLIIRYKQSLRVDALESIHFASNTASFLDSYKFIVTMA